MSAGESTPAETTRDEFARPVDYTTPATKPFSLVRMIAEQQERRKRRARG